MLIKSSADIFRLSSVSAHSGDERVEVTKAALSISDQWRRCLIRRGTSERHRFKATDDFILIGRINHNNDNRLGKGSSVG